MRGTEGSSADNMVEGLLLLLSLKVVTPWWAGVHRQAPRQNHGAPRQNHGAPNESFRDGMHATADGLASAVRITCHRKGVAQWVRVAAQVAGVNNGRWGA